MIAVSPALQALVDRILDGELRDTHDDDLLAARLSLAFERLHEVTAGAVGETGYLALMRRVLHTARTQFPWLATATGDASRDFPHRGWSIPLAAVGSARARACATSLFAGLLGLLAGFIGEDFTLRLVRRAWLTEPARPDNSARLASRVSASGRARHSAANMRRHSAYPKKSPR